MNAPYTDSKGGRTVTEKTKNRLYLAVCIACLLTCLLLIGSIFWEGRTRPGDAQPAPTEPESAQGAGTGGEQMLITEEYAKELLQQRLPEGLPLEGLNVRISREGLVAVEGQTARDGLRDYLKAQGVDLGLQGELMLSLLPQKISIMAAFSCQSGENGQVTVTPAALELSDREIDPSLLPSEWTGQLSRLLSGLLSEAGGPYSSLSFRDGVFVLIP